MTSGTILAGTRKPLTDLELTRFGGRFGSGSRLYLLAPPPLKLRGTDHPKRAMAATRVIERFYEEEHADPRVAAVMERAAIDELTFERREERFAHRVIEAIPD